MRVPYSWIREFTPIDLPPDEVAAVLDDLGLVVESVEHVGEGLGAVVVARVAEIAAVEGADRIRRVVVDAGGADPVEVVCGAWNFAVGDLVPLAPVGAVLPGGFVMTERTIRGVVSKGMLCSGRELGLSDDGEGIWILGSAAPAGEVPPGSPPEALPEPGDPFAAAVGVEIDTVFDIAVEGNRPDALCMAGIARDLAARLGLAFEVPDLPGPPGALAPAGPLSGAGPGDSATTGRGRNGSPAGTGGNGTRPESGSVSITVASPDLCDRFGAWVIEGVDVGPSPGWMQRRLTLAGMRPINNVVDVSNYVMLELGQPNHPYDLDALDAPGLVVRAAEPGEKIETLDGTVRTLGLGYDGKPGPRDCLICDAAGTPVGVAGIMGGTSSEIGPSTRRVLLEVAHFAPMSIARTAKRIGARTEASLRFERGCDPAGIERAGRRFARILAGVSPGATVRVSAEIDRALGEAPQPVRISLRVRRVRELLGTSMDAGTIAGYLAALGFEAVVSGDGETVDTGVPTFRPDCEREIDLVEEVARLHGYSRIERSMPVLARHGGLSPYQRERRRLRDAVAFAAGADEAWTSTFLPPGDNARAGFDGREIVVLNPVAREESVLRQTVLPGLLRAAAYNASHRNPDVRVFEIGHVFRSAPGSAPGVPDEREVLAVLLAGEEGDEAGGGAPGAVAVWREVEALLRLGGVEVVNGPCRGLHAGRSARLVAGGATVGALGEVDPVVAAAFGCAGRRIGYLEVDLGWESSGGRSTEGGTGILSSVRRRPDGARPVSHLPSADVDLALVARDGVSASTVAAALEEAAGDLAEWVRLFDVFRGPGVAEGARSLAYRIRLSPTDHTLVDSEIAAVRARCIDAAAKLGATLRS